MTSLKTFQDFRAEISIVEIALANGYKLITSDGLKWPVLKNEATGEKIIIVNSKSTGNQGYFNPTDDHDKGTLIDFVRNRLGSVFPYNSIKSEVANINSVLYGHLKLDPPERRYFKKVDFVIQSHPEKAFLIPEKLRSLTDPDYLLSRGLKAATLETKEFTGRILNLKVGEFENIAFPYYTSFGEMAALELRNKNFKQFVDGSDVKTSIWHSNLEERIDAAVLTESPIDALSYHQLKGKNNILYASFGGALSDGQVETLFELIEKNKNKLSTGFAIIAAFDNDKMGEKYTDKISAAFSGRTVRERPILKDFNEDVRRERRAGMRI